MSDLLLRDVRVVAIDDDAAAPTEPVDVLVRDGVIAEVGPGITGAEEVPVLDGGGRHVVPGLWDTHVHMVQWALGQTRLDTAGTASPSEVLARVVDRLTWGFDSPTGVLVGWGHRTGRWLEQPTVAALDAVTGEVPVALISGDGHHGWLNTPALRLLGSPPVDGVVAESEWFPLYDRLQRLQGRTRSRSMPSPARSMPPTPSGWSGSSTWSSVARGSSGASAPPRACRRCAPAPGSTPRAWRTPSPPGCAPAPPSGPPTAWSPWAR
ncbi:amidohydrolase family protein [Serinicoccus marinus]|uniref:amidohydrolase family protein n=1 Tax=Serinicoccus marinus TaxID=247333 RepID=UPI001EE973B7|nr:amidohydrolase family protein [Serinicoccus marinus]